MRRRDECATLRDRRDALDEGVERPQQQDGGRHEPGVSRDAAESEQIVRHHEQGDDRGPQSDVRNGEQPAEQLSQEPGLESVPADAHDDQQYRYHRGAYPAEDRSSQQRERLASHGADVGGADTVDQDAHRADRAGDHQLAEAEALGAGQEARVHDRDAGLQRGPDQEHGRLGPAFVLRDDRLVVVTGQRLDLRHCSCRR